MRKFELTAVPKPEVGLNLEQLLAKPLILEIGGGVGWHGVQLAQTHPRYNVLVIERTRAKYEKMLRRVQRHASIDNFYCLHRDAVHWVSHWLPASCVDSVFILYPNPYPKASQANKRFHRMPFMDRLIRVMKENGRLVVATNMGSLATECRFYLREVWQLEEIAYQRLGAGHLPRSHFEKKYMLAGHNCFNIEFQKPALKNLDI